MPTTDLQIKNTWADGETLPDEWLESVADYLEGLASFVSVSLAGLSGDQTLSEAQYRNGRIKLTGAMAGNVNLILPTSQRRGWTIWNTATGGTVTAKTAAGTGYALTANKVQGVFSDGTNIELAQTDVAGLLGLTGLNASTVADANVIGGLPVIHRIDVAAGTTGNVDVTLTHKTRVIDVWLVKRNGAGGGAGTIQVFNGASAISNAISIDIADQAIARATSLDDAAWEIAAAGTLRVTRTRTASTDETCTVFVSGLRVA